MQENKERLIGQPESIKQPDIIINTKPDIGPVPREVKTWMEKVEQTQTNPVPLTDDKTGAPLLTPAAPSNPVIVLPTTRTTFTGGFTKTVNDAGRWLSEFILRLIKIKKGNVKFKEE
jgi:hypothetical protein